MNAILEADAIYSSAHATPLAATSSDCLPALTDWLDDAAATALRQHWQQAPLRLRNLDAAALRCSAWLDPTRIDQWFATSRLRTPRATLWRHHGPSGALPIDPRAWSRERRLGEHTLDDLIDATAVKRQLADGGWLQLRAVQRIDGDAAQASGSISHALQAPVQTHVWRGQAPSALHKDSVLVSKQRTRLTWSGPAVTIARLIIIVSGKMTIAWHALDAATASAQRLPACTGDLIYLPPGEALSFETTEHVLAVEFELPVRTALSVLQDFGGIALCALREDVSMRGHQGDAACSERLAIRTRFVEALHGAHRQTLPLPPQANATLSGRLTAISQSFDIDLDTQLIGQPEQLRQPLQAQRRCLITRQGRQLVYPQPDSELITRLLATQPYRLRDLPAAIRDDHRIDWARRLMREGLVRRCEGKHVSP